MNKSPKHERKTSLRNKAIAVVAAGAALTLAGCTTESAPAPSSPKATSSAENTTPMPSAPTERSSSVAIPTPVEATKSQYDLSREYTQNAERSATISAAVTKAGERIVAAAESGELGRFEFYNYEQDTWNSEGWGYLQHNPQYGDSGVQVSTQVYRSADGTYDLSRGIRDVEISFGGTTNEKDLPSVMVMLPPERYDQAWETSSFKYYGADGPKDERGIPDYRYAHGSVQVQLDEVSVDTLKAEDQQVLTDLQAGMDETFGAGW